MMLNDACSIPGSPEMAELLPSGAIGDTGVATPTAHNGNPMPHALHEKPGPTQREIQLFDGLCYNHA